MHEHEHDHDHAHHSHPHSHEHSGDKPMSPEEVLALLNYMLDHNRHHADELHDICHALEDEGKTEAAAALAEALKVDDKKVLLVLPESNVNLQLSCRNLTYVKPVLAQNVCTYDVMNASAIVMVEGAENVLNTMLA